MASERKSFNNISTRHGCDSEAFASESHNDIVDMLLPCYCSVYCYNICTVDILTLPVCRTQFTVSWKI